MKRVYILAALAGLALSMNVAAQNPYRVITVADGGSVVGTVTWSGPQPHLTNSRITKDLQICDPDSQKTRDLERLIIGPQGGVANTVVYLKDVSQGKAFDFPQSRRFLDQKQCRYEPHILLVPEDAALQMRSSDPTLHTIHMDGAASYNLPFPFPDKVVSRDMKSPGVVNLKCNGGHVWMNAEMFVAPNPYYTVTDLNGRFELTNVPPGQYAIVAWHEGWNVVRQESSYDVLTERLVQRPIFTPPTTHEKSVAVKPGTASMVNFAFSLK